MFRADSGARVCDFLQPLRGNEWSNRTAKKRRLSRKHANKTCAAGAVQAYSFNAPGETGTPNLLIRSQHHTLTNLDILPDFIGKPSVGAGLSRHSCSIIQGETDPKTGPVDLYGGLRCLDDSGSTPRLPHREQEVPVLRHLAGEVCSSPFQIRLRPQGVIRKRQFGGMKSTL